MAGNDVFLDALTDGAPDEVSADICIIGGGMAGLTLAANLANSRLNVLVLESGGRDIEGATQGLYIGRNTGLPYYDLAQCRLRYLGGTSNHWGGNCRPNDSIDYAGRPELGLPAWPINEADLAPYVEIAAGQLGLTIEGFSADYQFKRAGISTDDLIEMKSEKLETKVFQISHRRRVSELYQLDTQPNLRVLLHANVTHIQIAPDGKSVDQLVVQTLGRRVIRAKSKTYVLACHGIENARLLLASNDVMPEGIGNASDQVGRNFMEHAYIHSGLFTPAPGRFPRAYDMEVQEARWLFVNVGLTEAALRQEQMLQFYCRFRPVDPIEKQRLALRNLRKGFFEPFDESLLSDIAQVAGSLGNSARVIGEKLGMDEAAPEAYTLDYRIEQAPNPDSRVVLADEVDELGSRRANLNWQLRDLDHHSFARGQAVIAAELSAAGMGRFQLDELTPDLINERVKGHYHHIGTTRMSNSPSLGVVDAECRVHGVDNLYIAGSSVYPTAGFSGPTMMLMALTIRLAEHLKEVHS